MNKKLTAWIVGGVITASVAVFGLSGGIGNAAEPKKVPSVSQDMHNHTGGTMDPKAMVEMMKSSEMQKQCLEALQDPEMQQAMKDMMRTPEMQTVMKQMLQSDAGFHQMMIDLVNSVDMNHSTNDGIVKKTPSTNSHSGHGH